MSTGRWGWRGIVAAVVAVVATFWLEPSASAGTGTLTVATVVMDGTAAAWGTTEVAGAVAYDTATLTPTGATPPTPTGTLTYSLFTNGTCNGTASKTETVTLKADGTVPAGSSTTALAAGSYSYSAAYAGDTSYAAATGPCEPFTVGKAPTSVTSAVDDAATSGAWSGGELAGAKAYDVATVAGGVAGLTATGSVTYSLFKNATCSGTASTTDTETLAGGVAPKSTATAALGAGSYSFGATYSGDASYATSTAPCAPFSVGATLALSPQSPSTPPSGSIAFSASGGTPPYTFSLSTNGSGGTIGASTGAYTAGTAGGTSDTVLVKDSAGATASTTVTVTAGLAVVPANPSVWPRDSVAFQAEGGVSPYTWALATNASGGSISATTGEYTAGATAGVTDVVKVTDGAGSTATTNVKVGAGVTITPASPTVSVGTSIDFLAQGGNGIGFTWAMVSSGSGGTIHASTGSYTAGGTPGTDVVGVTDSLGNAGSTTVTVTLAAKPGADGGVDGGGSDAGRRPDGGAADGGGDGSALAVDGGLLLDGALPDGGPGGFVNGSGCSVGAGRASGAGSRLAWGVLGLALLVARRRRRSSRKGAAGRSMARGT